MDTAKENTTHRRNVSQIFSSMDRNRHKSTVQSQSELITTHNGYVGKELATGQQINVLSVMQCGCKLLKLCNRRTRSHWRKFQLDSNNEKIYWVSDKKDVSNTTIYIANITEIVCHSIHIVNKFKDTLPQEITQNKALQQQQFTIRYVEHNSDRTNHLDDSYTKSDSSSNYIYIHDTHETNDNNNTNTSFWKKLLHSTIVPKQAEEDIIDTDKRQHETNNSDANSEDNDYHLQELHLMAETPRIATIWAYGLECLIKLYNDDINLKLSEIPMSQFKISIKELMNYNMDINNDLSCLKINEKKVQQFKTQLEKINCKLYSIIEQMPNYCTVLENDAIEHFDDSFLIKKVKQDQNDLETVLYEVNQDIFDECNLKRWSYILTRIDINCGAYTIAINNQKHSQNKGNA